MSLINKMLQDLDARGGAVVQQASVKPVPREEARPPLLLAGAGIGLLAVLAAAGLYGWRHASAPAAPPAPPAPPIVAVPVPVPVPVPAPMPVSVPAPVPIPVTVAEAPRARQETPRPPAPKKASAAVAVRPPPRAASAAPLGGHSTSPQQSAENAYRRALAALQEGRVAEALAALEQALQIDAHHDAARQTLVGLLIENKRPDEAMRELQLGLTLEPRQPSMAMLLARLQIERGGSGIETLMRSLPDAADNSEYHAFLAGALQRQQRHREASEQYQAALRGMPQNGVWLMGLGISLQADKRNAEAVEAFRKAKASANLTPELQAFVERKLQQISL